MEQKKNGLLRSLLNNFTDAAREFPIALSYLVVLAFIIGLPQIKYSDSTTFGLPCVLACLGSLAASLMTRGGKKIYRVTSQIGVLLLAVLYLLVFLHSDCFQFNPRHLDNHLEIWHSFSGYALILLVIIFFPFWYKGEHAIEASWSTTMTGLVGLMRAALVAICVLIAMSVITIASDLLLNFEIFGQFWLTFVPVTLFGALTIASFTKSGQTNRKMFRLLPFSRGVFTFVSVPLLAIYLLIFYLYLIKMAIAGSFPVRDISYQVIGVFIAFCMQRYVFHQALINGDNPVARWFNKLSPWLLFLPVTMMSWVIIHRLLSMGITVNRLYILLVNLWMYGILVWWIATKASKIWIMPVSLCVILSITSIPVLNVTSVTETSMRSDLKSGMTAAGWQLPVSDNFFKENSWKVLNARQRSLKTYLEDEMGEESLDGIVSFGKSINDSSKSSRNDDSGTSSDDHFYISSKCYASFDSIPAGCTAINVEDYSVDEISLVGDSVVFSIGDYGALIFSMRNLKEIDSRRNGLNEIQVIGSTGHITGASISYIYVSGNIVEGVFKGKTYSHLTGTIFLPDMIAKDF